MDDSFDQLARKIRQNKIDKKQLRRIKNEVFEVSMKKTEKNKMATYIQKIARGFLSRKKFSIFLQKINVNTVIEYLHDKKKTRIHEHNKEIISFFILKYLNKERKKISIQKKKEDSINLIKARLRGIIARKKYKAKTNLIKRSKKKLLKYILSFKIKLILSCNEIQEILSDIAEIKNSLKNIDKQTDINNKSQNIKDLKTKLNKSLNSFYTTFYKIKNNSEWTTQNKTDQPWISKYMDILKKDNLDTEKKTNSNTNMVYVNTSKKGSYSITKANKSIGQTQYLQIKIKPKKYLGIEDRNKTIEQKQSEVIENKCNITNNTINTNITNNETTNNEKIDVLKFDEEQDEFIKKNSNEDENKIKVNKTKKTTYIYNKKNSNYNSMNNNNTNNTNNTNNDSSNFLTTENINDENVLNKNNNNSEIEINNNKNERAPKYNKNTYEFEEELKNNENENNKKTPLDENKYQQRDERPIKPLNNNNFLETDNPFGNRRGSKITKNPIINNLNKNPKNSDDNTIKNTKTFKETLSTNNKTKIDTPKIKNSNSNTELNEKEKENEKENENNKYNQYDNRPCGGSQNYNEIFNNEKKRGEERPLGGSKKIDYNEMFKDENFNEFSGDPFGGAKQFESKNKKNINTNNNNENSKKKPVYDARKAIEEAKIKEEKEGGKKEKPSAFREFLKEMRKVTAEEKKEKNKKEEDKKENNNKNVTNSEITKTRNVKKIRNEKNEEENNLKNEFTNTEDSKISKNKPNPKFKKDPETKEIALRKKLHELEKAPAPMPNIKGVKSRIECWGINNTKNKVSPSKNKEKDNTKKTPTNASSNYNKNVQINQKEIDEFIAMKKQKEINKEEEDEEEAINQKAIDEFINMKKQRQMNSNTNINRINNKVVEEKIEKYVDKKLLQLNLQIEEIDDIFNLEDYFKDKDIKMKKFYSIPYIKEEFDFVQNYTNDEYEDLITKIQDQYKELK